MPPLRIFVMQTDESMAGLPVESIIRKGLADLKARKRTVPAYLVSMAGTRLRCAGLFRNLDDKVLQEPELPLYRLLLREGGDAYSRYNSLLRELISFENALDHRINSSPPQSEFVFVPSVTYVSDMKKSSKVTDWANALKPLFEKYGKRKHPLDYKSKYQLVIMVVLSARDSDRHINELAPALFKAFPSMKELAKAEPEDLYPYMNSVTNFSSKAKWIVTIAKIIRDDDNIPSTLEALTSLPGIGRKSANVIISESGGKAEGVIVDLHVIRVAPRLGIATGTNPEKIERQIMEKIPQKHWRESGMGMSFLGREVCRPTNPHCDECVVNSACEYYAGLR